MVRPSKGKRPRKAAPPQKHGYPAPKPTVDQLLASQSRFNKASTDFLKLDLETALTFTGLALQTDERTKRERNQRAARRAYDTILRLLDRVTLSDADAEFFEHNLKRLKSELIALGESL